MTDQRLNPCRICKNNAEIEYNFDKEKGGYTQSVFCGGRCVNTNREPRFSDEPEELLFKRWNENNPIEVKND